MQINIILFGQLCEVLGESLILYDIADTDNLQSALKNKYPALNNSKYVMAVNKKLVTENTVLTQNCTVALLPPFSGG